MRAIGVDLHTTQITVCYLSADGTTQRQTYPLTELEKFRRELKDSDEIAVEATSNPRWFINQVAAKVKRVVRVNPRQFELIRQSVKKTDQNDAESLAHFLRANLLPEVRGKSEECERVQGLNQTREKLVRLRTTLFGLTKVGLHFPGDDMAAQQTYTRTNGRTAFGGRTTLQRA